MIELSKRFFVGLDEGGQDDVLFAVLDRLADDRPLELLVFIWVEYDDEPLEEVARRIGVSKKMVWNANERAARILFQMVEDELDARGVRCVASGTEGRR